MVKGCSEWVNPARFGSKCGLREITENKTSLGNGESMCLLLGLRAGWTETLSKATHRSRVLAGDAAGALGLSEHVPKAERECKSGSTTIRCCSTAVTWLLGRAEPPVRLLFISRIVEYVYPKMHWAFRSGAYSGGGQRHHLPVEYMRSISGFWKGQILLLVTCLKWVRF